MFEHYLTYQKADPRRQRRIMIASIVSGTLTFSGIIFVWAANKMTISKVGDKPPEGPCCLLAPRPLTPEEEASDAERKKAIEEEIKILEGGAPPEQPGKGKKGKGKKGK